MNQYQPAKICYYNRPPKISDVPQEVSLTSKAECDSVAEDAAKLAGGLGLILPVIPIHPRGLVDDQYPVDHGVPRVFLGVDGLHVPRPLQRPGKRGRGVGVHHAREGRVAFDVIGLIHCVHRLLDKLGTSLNGGGVRVVNPIICTAGDK